MIAERKNINRGYRKLCVWQRAIDLCVAVCEKVKKIPGHPYRLMGQLVDAAASIHANIAEGYCRRSIQEYLNFLNIALASLGELVRYCTVCTKRDRSARKITTNLTGYTMRWEMA